MFVTPIKQLLAAITDAGAQPDVIRQDDAAQKGIDDALEARGY